MRIAFYAPMKPISDPVASGDREIARDLHRRFLEQGHDVFILSEFRTRFFFLKPWKWIEWFFRFTMALLRCLRHPPDVFFTYHSYYKAPDAIAPLLSLMFGKPYFLNEAMYSQKPRSRPLDLPGYLINLFALKRSTHIFSNKSDDIAGLLKVRSADRVTYLLPAIDLDLFQRRDESRELWRQKMGLAPTTPLVACSAMLRPGRKTEGVRFLIRSLKRLQDRGVDFHFVHIGAGLDESLVRGDLSDLLPRRSTYLGAWPREQIPAVLSAADVFAFPGIDEGFGMVYLEAQAMKLPVAAFDNGGIPDAVMKNETAFLTPLLNEAAYDEALFQLLTQPSLRERMGEAGRAHVMAKHDLQKSSQSLSKKISEAVK